MSHATLRHVMKNHLECAIATACDGARHVERVSASVAAMQRRIQRVRAIVDDLNRTPREPHVRAAAAQALQQMAALVQRTADIAQSGAELGGDLSRQTAQIAAIAERCDALHGAGRTIEDVPAALRAAIQPIVARVLRGRFIQHAS